MYITITFSELIDKGMWDEFCKLRGMNVWCVKEGLAVGEDEARLSKEEAKKLGFIL